MLAAVCVHPCITTTTGAFAGKLAGTWTNMSSGPGFVPKLVIAVSAAAIGMACIMGPSSATGMPYAPTVSTRLQPRQARVVRKLRVRVDEGPDAGASIEPDDGA